jgi:hypothetical protein
VTLCQNHSFLSDNGPVTSVDNDGGTIVTNCSHEAARHVFVASRNGNVAIVMLSLDTK